MPAPEQNQIFSKTQRLTLRRLAPNDLSDFQLYRTDPAVGLYQGWSVMTDDEALHYINEMGLAAAFPTGEWFQLAIADSETDKLIGDIGVHLSSDQNEAEIGISLSPQSQGQGLAAEALNAIIALLFDITKIERVVAVTDSRNTASIRLLERAGMTKTGSNHLIWRGECCEEYSYLKRR